MLDPEIKREIIMENYQNPTNRTQIKDDKYMVVKSKSETCIDDIDLYILIEDDIIKDIHFDGEACAISTSATSIMIKLLLGKSISEVKKIMQNYYNMINEQSYDEDILGEANCYEDIYKQQNRIGCATIPWHGIEKAIQEYENNKI